MASYLVPKQENPEDRKEEEASAGAWSLSLCPKGGQKGGGKGGSKSNGLQGVCYTGGVFDLVQAQLLARMKRRKKEEHT